MKVLIISANSLGASPTGPAYIAGAALQAGHTVRIFEGLFANDLTAELKEQIQLFNPDVIGVSIRLVHAFTIDETAIYNTRHLDLRPYVKQVINIIRETTDAPIVLGGPGFNYYASDWLEYLDVDFGIRGEADLSFPLFLDKLEQDGDLSTIPGVILRRNGQFQKMSRDLVPNLDETALPAYELLKLARYQELGISPGILTKRGCAFRCTYCPYRSLEGNVYRLKSPKRVVDEIDHIQKSASPPRIMFCENNFNIPNRHAKAICQEIKDRKISIHWGTGDLRPMGITEDFCRLMQESGCDYVNLSIESGSDEMLKRMQRGYKLTDVHQSLRCLQKAGIPFGISMMIGSPGENPETIRDTVKLIDSYEVPLGTWLTVGVCLWTPRQEVVSEARKTGQLTDDRQFFEGVNYLSPELSKSYMEKLINALRMKPGVSVQVNQPYVGFQWTNDESISNE